jgi:DNA recombination protein RmuC
MWRTAVAIKQAEMTEAAMKHEKALAHEKLEALHLAQSHMMDSFKALSGDALRKNNESFLHLAQTKFSAWQADARGDFHRRQEQMDGVIKPIKETLLKMDEKLHTLEKSRCTSESKLSDQLIRLQQETSLLVRALRQPHVRGKWGEVQLRRVVEMAGMLEYCDFNLQETTSLNETRRRPDMIVRLPGGKNVIVDAKTPLHAYLEAYEIQDEGERILKLKEHAKQVRHHIDELSKKSYWDQFEHVPEFVVLFLPGETFFSAALEQDPSLIERGVEQKVILATPTTLIALLRAVSYGWRQERLAENAQQIFTAGKQLYERLCTFTDHLAGIKKGIDQSVKSYNLAIGSYESRVMVSARKLNDLGASNGQELPAMEALDVALR